MSCPHGFAEACWCRNCLDQRMEDDSDCAVAVGLRSELSEARAANAALREELVSTLVHGSDGKLHHSDCVGRLDGCSELCKVWCQETRALLSSDSGSSLLAELKELREALEAIYNAGRCQEMGSAWEKARAALSPAPETSPAPRSLDDSVRDLVRTVTLKALGLREFPPEPEAKPAPEHPPVSVSFPALPIDPEAEARIDKLIAAQHDDPAPTHPLRRCGPGVCDCLEKARAETWEAAARLVEPNPHLAYHHEVRAALVDIAAALRARAKEAGNG